VVKAGQWVFVEFTSSPLRGEEVGGWGPHPLSIFSFEKRKKKPSLFVVVWNLRVSGDSKVCGRSFCIYFCVIIDFWVEMVD